MGKLAILVLGVVIGSTWLTSSPANPTTVCVDPPRSSESAPARSEPDEHLDKIKDVGGEVWHRIVQPTLAYAATHALDALMGLLRAATDDPPSEDGRSHASLRPAAPAHAPTR